MLHNVGESCCESASDQVVIVPEVIIRDSPRFFASQTVHNKIKIKSRSVSRTVATAVIFCLSIEYIE